MSSYRIEVVNVANPSHYMVKYNACTSMFSMPVILIPGIESPFRGLGMKHDSDERYSKIA